MKNDLQNNVKPNLLHSKPVIISAVILFLTALVLLGINVVNKIQQERFDSFMEQGNAIADNRLFTDPVVATPKVGKYYLNGDKNSYYFEILEGNKIRLCADDMYSVFETWNPGKDDIIKDDVARWEGTHDFVAVVIPTGTVVLSVDQQYDEDGNLTGYSSGPCLLDENTLGNWGNQGDFYYVE